MSESFQQISVGHENEIAVTTQALESSFDSIVEVLLAPSFPVALSSTSPDALVTTPNNVFLTVNKVPS